MIDEIPPLQPETIIPQQRKSFSILPIGGVIVLVLVVGIGAYYMGKRSASVPVLQQTENTAPSPSITQEMNASPSPSQMTVVVDKAKLKTAIESASNPKITIEVLDVSPQENTKVAYLAHDENWSKFGIYLYDTETLKTTTVYEVNESITGRGGYYMDNTALEFSPTGEAFYVNRTGINFPPLVIALADGTVLMKGTGDAGASHATWVSGQKLVYLNKNQTYEYDIKTKLSTPTKLSAGVFHMRSNSVGNKLYAFSVPKNELQCQTFDLHVFSYPDGIELKTIQNTTLEAQWNSETVIAYEKVTGCKKNTGETLSEFAPVASQEKISVE